MLLLNGLKVYTPKVFLFGIANYLYSMIKALL